MPGKRKVYKKSDLFLEGDGEVEYVKKKKKKIFWAEVSAKLKLTALIYCMYIYIKRTNLHIC